MDGGGRLRRGADAGAEWAYSARLPDALSAPHGWGAAVPGIPVRNRRSRPDEAPPADRDRDDGGKDAGKKDADSRDGGKAAGAGGDAKEDGKPAAKPRMSRGKRILYWLAGLMVLATLVTVGVLYWLNSRHYETTDDAFVDGNISQVSAQVSGRVTRIAFTDNQEVRAGQVLVELDPRDFQVRLDQARTQLAQAYASAAQARAQLSLQQASVDQAVANVHVTEADLGQAQSDLARYKAIDPKAITRQQLDNQGATTKAAAARLDANRQGVAGARAQVEAQRGAVAAQDAAVEQAKVAVANAELQLSYTTVVAPANGQVTRRTVELGNVVSPGQALLAVVQDGLWVTANFKETQLAAMKDGQYVRVRVDACPGVDLDAKVGSFQGGSGQVFSSLPAENATGNYVKVVQRLPVRLYFNDLAQARERCRMAPGMSVGPRVTVR